MDFTTLWSQPGIDLLRPLHSNKYIGSQWSPDDKRSEHVDAIEQPLEVSAEDDDDNNYDNIPVGMDIEDFLDSDAIPEDIACDFDKFLMVSDKKYMKSSVITAMLSSKRA